MNMLLEKGKMLNKRLIYYTSWWGLTQVGIGLDGTWSASVGKSTPPQGIIGRKKDLVDYGE